MSEKSMATQVAEFISTLDGLRNIDRWNGIPAIDRSNVMEHLWRVVLLCKLIMQMAWPAYKEENSSYDDKTILLMYRSLIAEVLMYAEEHDIGERFTGDLNHALKFRYAGFKEILDKIEKDEVKRVYPNVPVLGYSGDMKMVKEIVKCADLIDMIFEALKETQSVNNADIEYHKAIIRGVTIVGGFTSIYADVAMQIIGAMIERVGYQAPEGIDASYS